MKVRKGSILMLLVALAMVFSLVAAVPAGADSTLPPEDSWGGMPMPNTQDWNLAPGTDVGPLAMDDEGDGTLHAGVYDAWDSDDDADMGTRWGSPRGTVRWAVFYSTDGGYDWKMGWELPEDDPGPIIDIVQAPGYEHPGWVYMITPYFLYYSMNGGEDFLRASRCPGVWDIDGATGGYLTSLDVTQVPDACPSCDEYMAVVGVACGDVDGVFTYNDEGVGLWYDKEITNYPAGAGPEGSVEVYEVRFSPNYADDLGIWAVAYYDPSDIGSAFDTVYTTYVAGETTLVSWYDGTTRTWANEYLDAPLTKTFGTTSIGMCDYAVLDYGDDFDIDNAPQCYVGIAGTVYDDVWQVKTLPPAAGPSSASRQNISGGNDQPIDSIAVWGASIMTERMVGIRDVAMPGMNGLELQRKLVDEGIDLPVVFITGHGNVQMAVGAMQAGAVNFLEKPFHEQELWDSIRRALELNEQDRQRRLRRGSVEKRLAQLTEGEREVLDLILDGKYNKEIAASLNLSIRTIEDRRARLMKKMEASSVAELVQLALIH